MISSGLQRPLAAARPEAAKRNSRFFLSQPLVLLFVLASFVFSATFTTTAVELAEDWPTFKHDFQRTGCNRTSKAPNTANIRWEVDIPDAGKFWSSPSVARGKVCIGNQNGTVYCVEAATGKLLWKFETKTAQPVFCTPTIVNDTVFVAGYEIIYALPLNDPDDDGSITAKEVLWSFRTGKSTGGVNDVVCGSPAVVNGKLFLGAVDQYFYCLSAARQGNLLWKTYTPYRGQHAFASSPAADGGKVIAATGNQSGSGRLYCFGETEGKILWEFDIDDITYSSPVIDENRVYIANSGDWVGGNLVYKLYCLDANGFSDKKEDGVVDNHKGNSDLLWQYDTRDYVYGTPSLHAGRLYFGACNGVISCLDAINGNLLWECKTPAKNRAQPRGVFSSPAIADGKVFICTIEGKLLALPENDPDNDGVISPGEVIWSSLIGGEGVCSPVVAYGCVFVGNHRGRLFCFGPPPVPAKP